MGPTNMSTPGSQTAEFDAYQRDLEANAAASKAAIPIESSPTQSPTQSPTPSPMAASPTAAKPKKEEGIATKDVLGAIGADRNEDLDIIAKSSLPAQDKIQIARAYNDLGADPEKTANWILTNKGKFRDYGKALDIAEAYSIKVTGSPVSLEDVAAKTPGYAGVKKEEEALQGRMGQEFPQRAQTLIDDATKNKAIQHIITGLVQAFAATQGATDVKIQGFDWDKNLEQRQRGLEMEQAGVKIGLDEKRQQLRDMFRVGEARAGEQRGQLARTISQEKAFEQQEKIRRDMEAKTKGKEVPAKVGPLLQGMNKESQRAGDAIKEIEKRLDAYDKTKDLKIQEQHIADIARIIGENPDDFKKIDKADRYSKINEYRKFHETIINYNENLAKKIQVLASSNATPDKYEDVLNAIGHSQDLSTASGAAVIADPTVKSGQAVVRMRAVKDELAADIKANVAKIDNLEYYQGKFSPFSQSVSSSIYRLANGRPITQTAYETLKASDEYKDLVKKGIISQTTASFIASRPTANVDTPVEFPLTEDQYEDRKVLQTIKDSNPRAIIRLGAGGR